MTVACWHYIEDVVISFFSCEIKFLKVICELILFSGLLLWCFYVCAHVCDIVLITNIVQNYLSDLISGKEPEKARERYDKANMKLHNLHNQYVLAVHSAQLHQEHYHESTLPLLLDSLQKMQEDMVSSL